MNDITSQFNAVIESLGEKLGVSDRHTLTVSRIFSTALTEAEYKKILAEVKKQPEYQKLMNGLLF